MAINQKQSQLIPIRGVRERYGDRSHMWVERRLKTDPKFPRPVYIGRLRFWRIDQLESWELSLTTKSPRIPEPA